MARPTQSRNAIVAAVAASAWLSGGMASISLLAIPALAESPSNATSVKQFKKMYLIGRIVQPPGTLATSLIFFYAAYRNYGGLQSYVFHSVAPWKLLSVAGAAVLAVLPFTYAVLEPTSHAILGAIHYHEIERNDGQEERVLLERWGFLNSIRATFPLLATGIGAWTIL